MLLPKLLKKISNSFTKSKIFEELWKESFHAFKIFMMIQV